MRILVTNDDGIDSLGLHELARSLLPLGDVVVCAPDAEYSGAGASLGPVHLIKPELHRASVAGIDEAWSITGAPALCVLFAGLGAIEGGSFDLVVAGINPGANVGGAIYHSGTVGAALTARQGGINAIAVSQSVPRGSHLGQGVEEGLDAQKWHTAATIAAVVARDLINHPPARPQVLNLNVPNVELADLQGWVHADVESTPVNSLTTVKREPKPGHEGAFHLQMAWDGARRGAPDPTTDAGAVATGHVALTWLSELGRAGSGDVTSLGSAIDRLLRR